MVDAGQNATPDAPHYNLCHSSVHAQHAVRRPIIFFGQAPPSPQTPSTPPSTPSTPSTPSPPTPQTPPPLPSTPSTPLPPTPSTPPSTPSTPSPLPSTPSTLPSPSSPPPPTIPGRYTSTNDRNIVSSYGVCDVRDRCDDTWYGGTVVRFCLDRAKLLDGVIEGTL